MKLGDALEEESEVEEQDVDGWICCDVVNSA